MLTKPKIICMLFLYDSNFFDTNWDTKKMFVAITKRFYLRDYVNKDGYSSLYLILHQGKKRERINLNLLIKHSNWNPEKQCLKKTSKNYHDYNLIIDNLKAKITGIETTYRLSKKPLTVELLAKELNETTPRVDFIKFMQAYLDEEIAKKAIRKGTIKKIKSVIKKLGKFRSIILFSDLNNKTIEEYKMYCIANNNSTNTISSNIRVIKKYIRAAQKLNIVMDVDLEEVKAPRAKSNRTDLHYNEITKLKKYLDSEFICSEHRHILATFLFSCYTGLRFSDLAKLNKSKIVEGVLIFNSTKTDKHQRIPLSQSATKVYKMINHDFNFTNQYMNREIKKICKNCNIEKSVTFHVARHSFATNLLRLGASPKKVQILLGHSSLKQTMEYVHLVEQEADDTVFLFDNL